MRRSSSIATCSPRCVGEAHVARPVVQGRDSADSRVEPQVAAVGGGGACRLPSLDRQDRIRDLGHQRIGRVDAAARELPAGPGHLDRMVAQPRILRGGVRERRLEGSPCRRRWLIELHPETSGCGEQVGHAARPVPVCNMPMEIGYGSVLPANSGSGPVLRSRSSSARAAWIGRKASIALWPSRRVLPCAARPETRSSKVRAPAFATTIRPLVGSVSTAASPPWPAEHGGERPESAVLLAHDRMHREPALERDAGGGERFGDREVRCRSGLHVAGAPAVQDAVSDRPAPRVAAHPLLEVAGRHDVDVRLQHERRGAAGPDPAGDAVPSLRGASVPG